MSHTSILPFQYQQFPVRMVLDDKGEPNWISKDVCDILSIEKHRDALSRLDEDQKGRPVIVDTPGGPQEMSTVTESGLYELILRSRKPEAKGFRKWITSEVLPQIRKTGMYVPTKAMIAVSQREYIELLQSLVSARGEIAQLYRKLKPSLERDNYRKVVSETELDSMLTLRTQGLTPSEIAKAVNRPVSTVRHRLNQYPVE